MNCETQITGFCKLPHSIFGLLADHSRQEFVQFDVERQWFQIPDTIPKHILSISVIRINFRRLQLQLTNYLNVAV